MSNTEFVRLDPYHRRERILDVAAELFAEYGFDAVTTLQLADKVGCSESSIFKLFPSKDQIYDTLFCEWERTVREPPEVPIVDNSALKTLRKFFNLYRTRNVSLHRNMRPRLESAVYSRRIGEYTSRIHDVLRGQPDFVASQLVPIVVYGQEHGEIREGDPIMIASLFWYILWGEFRLWYDESYQLSFQSFQDIFARRDKPGVQR